MSIRIILVDDHKIMRDGLRSLIEEQRDMVVVGEATNGRMAIDLVRELDPDVVVTDLTMPTLNGIESARQLRAESNRVRIIALSMRCDRRSINEMLTAGANGYLLKDVAFNELVSAIHTVMAGQSYLSPVIADVVVKDYISRSTSPTAAEASVFQLLSSREREVLQLLAEGRSTKSIAAELHLSPKTVETHRRNVAEKLSINSVAELTKYAIREGLTSLEC